MGAVPRNQKQKMRQLAKYSYANAKIRALISFLLPPALFDRMASAQDAGEILNILKGTVYRDVVETLPGELTSLLPLEKALVKDNLAACRKVHKSLFGKQEKAFIFLLMQRYELEELKVVLRIWHRKVPVDINDYLVGETISHEIDFRKILSARYLEEIILLLDHTPYKKPLMKARERFQEKNSVFYLEMALDMDYYQRLLDCAQRLSATDRKVAGKILGVEIDIENIRWLLRQRKYYALAIADMLDGVIPGGERISRETVRSFYATDGLSNLVAGIALGPYARVKDLVAGNVSLLENFLHEILFREVRLALSGFPFTVGIALGYLILKRRETKNIVSLTYAKDYRMPKEEIVSLINV